MHFLWRVVLVCALPTIGCGKGEENKAEVKAPVSDSKTEAEADEKPVSTPPETVKPEPKPEVKPVETAEEAKTDTNAEESPHTEATKPEEAAEAASGTSDDVPALGVPFLLKREGVQIAALTLARGIEKTEDQKRVPVEPGHSFVRDDRRVYAIMDLENSTETEGELKVGWIKPGGDKEGNVVTVSVKANKSWRTWAFNKYVNKEPGIWQVVIRDSEDAIIGRAAFEMKE